MKSAMQLSIGTHESAIATKEEWLTPPWLLKRLGEFDLDPCAPSDSRRPWSTALRHYSIEENGLAKPWEGRIWCNPPYGRKMGVWMQRLADHGNGIGLIIARTDTRAFFDSVWRRADAVLFLRGRLTFHHVNGKLSDTGCTAPNVLVAYGTSNVEVLRGLEDIGKFIKLRAQTDPLKDDEPIFVLKSTDEIAPIIVREWAYRYFDSKLAAHGDLTPKQHDKYKEALQLADAMERWRSSQSTDPLRDPKYLADIQALQDFVDCGHGQVVQNGCPSCERKIGHPLEDDSTSTSGEKA